MSHRMNDATEEAEDNGGRRSVSCRLDRRSINIKHELVQLAFMIDRDLLIDGEIAPRAVKPELPQHNGASNARKGPHLAVTTADRDRLLLREDQFFWLTPGITDQQMRL